MDIRTRPGVIYEVVSGPINYQLLIPHMSCCPALARTRPLHFSLAQPTQHSMKIKYLSIMIDWGLGRLVIETFRDKFKSFVCKVGSETVIVNQSVLEMIFSLHCDQFMCCVMRRRGTVHWGHWGLGTGDSRGSLFAGEVLLNWLAARSGICHVNCLKSLMSPRLISVQGAFPDPIHCIEIEDKTGMDKTGSCLLLGSPAHVFSRCELMVSNQAGDMTAE